MTHHTTTRTARMHDLLMSALTPTYIALVDESAQHRGHKGVEELKQSLIKEDGLHNMGNNLLETHFALEISAAALASLSRVKQHQLIYEIVAEEFKTGLHSLRISVLPHRHCEEA